MEHLNNQLTKELKGLCTALCQQHKSPSLHLSLLVGAPRSGKTSLLSQTNLHEHTWADARGNLIKFWYSATLIIIEIPQDWLTSEAFPSLLKKLSRSHPKLSLASAILCVDAHKELTTKAHPDNATPYAELTHLSEALPKTCYLSVVLTKTDSLAGFCEYYEDCHQSELDQGLGYSLNGHLPQANLIKLNKKKFNYLVKTMHRDALKKLHGTRNSHKRQLIREFPIQFELLRLNEKLLAQASHNLKLSGVYFTSARQHGAAIDSVSTSIAHHFALAIPNTPYQASNERAYFIEGFMKSFQRLTPVIIKTPSLQLKKPLAALGALFAVGFTAMTYFYYQSSQLIDYTNQELNNYRTLIQQPQQLSQAIFHLANASEALKNSRDLFTPYDEINRLERQIQQDYQHQIKQLFMPQTLSQLEQVLASPRTSLKQQYEALKVYLMLANPRHMNAKVVLQWFDAHWTSLLSNKDKRLKLHLLSQALRKPYQAMKINQSIVNDLRNVLNALPADYLYKSLLKNAFNAKTTDFALSGFNQTTLRIPAKYTPAEFNELIKGVIPRLSQQLIREHWVLAKTTQPSQEQLTLSLIQQYCSDYVAWWKKLSKQLKPVPFETYQQAALMLEELASPNALPGLIELIKINTQPQAASSNSDKLFNQQIASHFTRINLLSNTNLVSMQSKLRELSQYFSTLALSDNGQTAFDIAKSRFQNSRSNDAISTLYNQSRQLPAPMNRWVEQIASNAWFLIIQQAKHFINQQWQQQVYSFYRSNIDNHFPFAPLGQAEISLTDFNDFFSQYGRLNQFFLSYLKPFLDTQSAQWQPKQRDGLLMPLDAQTVTELVRANVIRQMFFKQSKRGASTQFRLQKLALDPLIAQIHLTIGSMQLTDNQTSQAFQDFNWPSKHISIDVYTIDGQRYTVKEDGDWALFKLLEQFNVAQDSNDNSQFELIFDINGNGGKYVLTADAALNPFIPGILKEFKLNKQVV